MRSFRDLKTLTTQPRRCRSHTIIAKNLTGFQQVEVSAKSLILRMRAVLTRDNIAAQRISIDEGAYFKGRVNIQREAPKEQVSGLTASSSK